MPDITTDIPTDEHEADSLLGAVDALIDEIDGVCEAFDRSRADEVAPARRTPDEQPAPESGLEAEVDRLVEDAMGGPTPPEASEPAAQAPAIETTEAPAESDAAPEAQGDTIDDIDAELAAAADEELAGDIETAEDLAGATAAFDDSYDQSLEEALDEEEASMPAPAPVKASPEPAPEASPEPVVETVEAARPARPKRDWHAIVAGVLSLPVSRLTRVQRDTIGWVALNTIFLAACVWLFVLLR